MYNFCITDLLLPQLYVCLDVIFFLCVCKGGELRNSLKVHCISINSKTFLFQSYQYFVLCVFLFNLNKTVFLHDHKPKRSYKYFEIYSMKIIYALLGTVSTRYFTCICMHIYDIRFFGMFFKT